MKHLSGLDATFLYLETPETPMHVGSMHLYDLPEGFDGDFYEEVKKHVSRRMHLAPVFHRKLALMPFELANPVWVEDDDVDLDYHIRRIMLPKPGTIEQLEAYVGRLHSSLLDRSRPLWEFYVIEGLQSGQVGFYSKVHHAAIDGQAGVAFASAVLDISPIPREVKQPVRRRGVQYQLGVAELIQAALTNVVAQYAKLIWYLPKTAKTLGSALIPEKDASGRRRFSWPKNLSLGPRTLFNVSITNQRTFGSVSIPLDEAKQIAKAVNVTINDVVLGLCSGAMRRYLEESGYDGVPKKPMVAAVPVSLREAGNTEQNTQATMMLCSLASHIKDPIERLKAIKSSTSAAKESINNFKAVIPTDFPSFGAPWLMSGLASLYGRSKIADNLPPIANVAISNVPGPPVPLYLAGARMRTYYPVSIIMHGMALNITVESYQGSLDFGLTACRRAIPDVKDLANYIADAHQELKTKVTAYLAEMAAKEEARALAPAPDESEEVTTERPRRGRRPKAVNIEITTPRTIPIEVEEVKVEAKPRRGRRPKAIPAEVITTEAQPASVTSIRTRRQRKTS